MNEQELIYAYLAGIIDGEAYIGITKREPTAANKMTSPRYMARIVIAMSDVQPVELFAKTFSLTGMVTSRIRQAHHKEIYSIEAYNEKALTVIDLVMPYLRVKVEQAKIVKELVVLQRTSKQRRTKKVLIVRKQGMHEGHKWTRNVLSDDYLLECQTLFEKARLITGRSKPEGGIPVTDFQTDFKPHDFRIYEPSKPTDEILTTEEALTEHQKMINQLGRIRRVNHERNS